MGQTVSFEDYIPPARFDAVPWTDARIEEALTRSGTYAVIDTVAITPDANPAVPMAQSFTTTNGTAPNLWYRVVFLDGSANESEPTTPARNVPGGIPGEGCSQWLTGDDVAACCEVTDASDSTVFDHAAIQAQELLFELSGRRFNGVCEQTVRPCQTGCGCAWQVLSRGHIVWNPDFAWGYGGYWGSWFCDDTNCGCTPLSRIPLAGYVQEVVEVVIDGEVLDPAKYRVDRHRWLVRQKLSADDGQAAMWPGCQNFMLPPGEPGTWSVTYLYGQEVPAAGVAAAVELACEITKACLGEECRLPSGTTRVARQGLTIERTPFTQWGWTTGKRAGQIKGWNTGMAMVDSFLNAFAGAGLPRQPVIWSPASSLRFPVPVTPGPSS